MAGVSGIFLGMLAGQLGNVFHVSSSVSGSILGPMQGMFIAGIYAPWVNAKVSQFTILTSFMFLSSEIQFYFTRNGISDLKLDCLFNYLFIYISLFIYLSIYLFINCSMYVFSR